MSFTEEKEKKTNEDVYMIDKFMLWIYIYMIYIYYEFLFSRNCAADHSQRFRDN